MVDKITYDSVGHALDHEMTQPSNPKYAYREGFKTRVPFTGSGSSHVDFETWANELMHANDYKNIRFVSVDLSHALSGDELKKIYKFTSSRHVIFTGIKNPRGLGYATIREASNHKAEKLFVAPTALEKIEKHDSEWEEFRNFISSKLGENEIDKYFNLLHENDWKENDYINYKYNYMKAEEKRIGITLKQLFILSFVDAMSKRGYDAELFLEGTYPGDYPGSYNQYDHMVIGNKN
jgi:hypothetical protein